jgi:hypothetical protein
VPSPPHLDEAGFRALLDDRGVLRPGALRSPTRAAAYAVFAQRGDAKLDVAAIERQAERFFGSKLGLTVDKSYGHDPLLEDAARVVLHSDDASASGTRLVYGRRVETDDVAAAEEAERRQGTFGMSALAQRCGAIWLVVPETDDDRVALTIAAIFASTMLGPILGPGEDGIFGVRTARMKLEGKARPYR